MMFACGMLCGAGITGIIAILIIWRHLKKAETAHDRYVREWQRAQYGWRNHTRAARHTKKRRWLMGWIKKAEAPMPLNLGEWYQ